VVALAFTAGVALILAVLDRDLAGRVGYTLESARIGLAEAGADSVERFELAGVEADLCNAITGGVWLAWILPRTREAARDIEFHVEAAGRRCRRTGGGTP
jgi:hypothetical protein